MLNKKVLENSDWSICPASNGVTLNRKWNGNCCIFSINNRSNQTVKIKEVAVFVLRMPFPEDTRFYGEGYNMLSQYIGTLEIFEKITPYSDHGHYKFPQEDGFFTVYNMLNLFPDDSDDVLLGFSSCYRFSGEFRFNKAWLKIMIDCENLEISPGETLKLEEFYIATGEREAILEQFGQQIAKNHVRPQYNKKPTGWCSWYCYGPDVTEQDVFDNLAAIKQNIPELEFIQLDDGYQNKMGDWLIPHPNFPNGVKKLCLQIKSNGFEPAIWVAPFIAEKDSELLKNHPDWFIKDDVGKPLSSGDVSFGGWRHGPWYMLDGTHPGAQEYLRKVFRVMREEWQCKYFKLDANMWGAMPFGRRYDSKATKVQAYRAGMRALIEGAGEDSFILGCNAPMWPSIGTVHGMRTTGDISRRWNIFKMLAEECFNRNWQNKKLWYNDPDCVVLNNLDSRVMGPDGVDIINSTEINEDEFSFHAVHILASGGMILSSDKIMDLKENHLNILRKLIASNGQAAKFDDRNFRVGRIQTEDGLVLCLLNNSNTESSFSVHLNDVCNISNYWTEETIARNVTSTPSLTLSPHSGIALLCK